MTLHRSRAAYNDVFFERRADAAATATAPTLEEVPEISEISQIPEIHDAVQASETTTARPIQATPPADEPLASVGDVQPVAERAAEPEVSFIADAIAVPGEPAAPPVLAPAVNPGTSPSDTGDDAHATEPQKKGFLNRLFGKFGK